MIINVIILLLLLLLLLIIIIIIINVLLIPYYSSALYSLFKRLIIKMSKNLQTPKRSKK